MIVEYVITGSVTVPNIDVFRDKYPEADIISVDAKEYVGQCDCCGRYIIAPDMNVGIECDICEQCYKDGSYYTDEQ
jgi:formylmethanofuran dehydrogenase subunit E